MSIPLPAKRVTLAVLSLSFAASAAFAQADPAAEQQIRTLISKTYDQPGHLVETAPIVIADDKAVAGWIQGARGGRALLSRASNGQWEIMACGGDGFKEAKTLQANGIPTPTAQRLASQLAKAEKTVPAERVKQFGLFGTPGDPGHADVGAHHPHTTSQP